MPLLRPRPAAALALALYGMMHDERGGTGGGTPRQSGMPNSGTRGQPAPRLLEAGLLGAEGQILLPGPGSRPGPEPAARRVRSRWLETCANPGCVSGWLHLLRSRSTPVFERGWTCSAACTRIRVAAAVRRDLEGRLSAPEAHRHRIPLGLTMLEQGWITREQLRHALEAQRGAGAGRLGHWLVRQQGVSEKLVTRALGLQWSCPVLPLDFHDAEALTGLLPRLFIDAFGALPLRVAAGQLLYLGFEDRLDPVLALAIERITGQRVESGLVQGSLFAPAHLRMLSSKFPRVELIEASSELAAVHALTKAIERARPVDSELVRVHDCLWLRMVLRAQHGPMPDPSSVEDLICSIGGH